MRQHPRTLPQSVCGPDQAAPSAGVSSRPAPATRPATAAPLGRRLISSIMAFVLAGLLWLPQALPAAAAPPHGPANPEDQTLQREARKQADSGGSSAAGVGGPNQPRSEIIRYRVQSGDTLYGISEKYDVSVETLIWANRLEANPALLRLGQELLVLPVSGVLHTVQPGDTLLGIAGRYKGDVNTIVALAANHLSGANALLQVGQQIIVPGGVKPKAAVVVTSPAAQPAATTAAPANAPQGSARFAWPVRGVISQRFYYYHPGIDIGDPTGTPVAAADSGYVAVAGWSKVGYGNCVVIDHGNGFRTLYAHMSRIDVKAGQPVQGGQQIGAVGATGNATGPHLHFEIQQNGAARNPLALLP